MYSNTATGSLWLFSLAYLGYVIYKDIGICVGQAGFSRPIVDRRRAISRYTVIRVLQIVAVWAQWWLHPHTTQIVCASILSAEWLVLGFVDLRNAKRRRTPWRTMRLAKRRLLILGAEIILVILLVLS